MNFWDLVWLEDGIRDTAECCTDIESEGKRTVIAAVRFPGVGSDGHKGRPPECVTEGKGEERDRKKVLKRNAYTQRGRSLPFRD